MAGNTHSPENSLPADDQHDSWSLSSGDTLKQVLAPLASLKLTVVLFAAAIVLVLIGTLAQAHDDIWEVIDTYFRTKIAWVELKVLFPPSFFPGLEVPDTWRLPLIGDVPLVFPFPGGWAIGTLMAVNLLAAHGLRFKLQAKGSRRTAGFLLLAAGMAATCLVIEGGSNKSGLQDQPLLEWKTLWYWIVSGLGAVWLGSGYALVKARSKIERWSLAAANVLVGGLFLYYILQTDAGFLGDSEMRILWQLLKAAFAGVILLLGCLLLFKKRGGIVLLHWGIVLLMFNELFVGLHAEEAQLTLEENQTLNYVRDTRELEIAVIDPSGAEDDVIVIPQAMIDTGKTISHEWLPFDIEVVSFLKNSQARRVEPQDDNPATAGVGLQWTVDEARAGTGADTDSAVDLSAAYLKFTDKKSSADLGTYLVALFLSENKFSDKVVTTDGKAYDVSMRFKRIYKDYAVTLLDVRKDDYLGTNTPRNYSSDIRLVDESRNVDREVKIWMNNPLRFAGETFYQSSYFLDPRTGAETTTLAVVTNAGWMVPYVCCMIVVIGMLAQFGITLNRFITRRAASLKTSRTDVVLYMISKFSLGFTLIRYLVTSRENFKKSKTKRDENEEPAWATFDVTFPSLASALAPTIIVGICATYLILKAIPPQIPENQMNLYEFGKLPLVYEGRVKPFDTLARNNLRVLSKYQTFKDNNDVKQPAMRWLLDLITQSDDSAKHDVFYIENREVLQTLGLQPRKGYTYSLQDLLKNADKYEEQLAQAGQADAKDLSVYQRKILELSKKIQRYRLLELSFLYTDFPPFPTREELEKDPQLVEQTAQKIGPLLSRSKSATELLQRFQPPLSVPNPEGSSILADKQWLSFTEAWTNNYVETILNKQDIPAAVALGEIFKAYKAGDAAGFNAGVENYRSLLEKQKPENLDTAKVNFEALFNHAEPFYYAAVLYLIAFVLTACSWLGWSGPLNRSAFWLIVFVAVVHTAAGIARIYISGRPPVTNLYSSAVFIGWGAVIFGIILELIYGRSLGNIIAAGAGFTALGIAHILAGDGDTFVVLQAVLDTQFWLATHVVCVTLGYTTTFVAGLLGLLYVLRGVLTPSLTPQVGKDLSRMIYGSVCFALFFSFLGTVLGGLWADDSWGRFWGWDPKENGALIIVLWNALILHARWGAMVKDRGLAILAIGGNIVTAWSWFGVNELGVGLHSYGFTDGVLKTLGIFVSSQLLIMLLGAIPQRFWGSANQLIPNRANSGTVN